MTPLDICIEQGADKRCPLCFLDDYSELDLTGFTARMEVRPSASSSKVLDLLTTENGRIEIAGSDITLIWPSCCQRERGSTTSSWSPRAAKSPAPSADDCWSRRR